LNIGCFFNISATALSTNGVNVSFTPFAS